MKVVIIGGAGGMGRTVVNTVATFPEVTEVVVLDRDLARAERVAAEAGPTSKAIAFDADRDDLVELLRGADAAVSTLGPFTKFGRLTLTAAIAAGVHYVDIMDDWEPTLEALELHAEAEKAGRTALVGMGVSPGVTNVLARRAAAGLDEVNDLITGWALGGTGAENGTARPNAALVHLVHECTGTIQVVEDGVEQQVRPLQPLVIDYPGIGEVEVRTVGHPEAVTLPRHVLGLTRSVNVMSGALWWLDHLGHMMQRVDDGHLSITEAAILIEEPVAKPAGAPATVRMPTAWAWASGIKDGRPTRVGVGLNRWPAGRMAGSTALPAAQALRMILRGEIDKRGVFAPEDVVPLDLLVERLEPAYHLPSTDIDMVTVSVESDD
ncbi:saccharopine dehydrogenase family protein [Rhodococcus koreensis]